MIQEPHLQNHSDIKEDQGWPRYGAKGGGATVDEVPTLHGHFFAVDKHVINLPARLPPIEDLWRAADIGRWRDHPEPRSALDKNAVQTALTAGCFSSAAL